MYPRTTSATQISYQGINLSATYNELCAIIGEHHSTDDAKSCYMWLMSTDSGNPFDIMDLNKGSDFEPDKLTKWNISSMALCISMEIKEILQFRLKEIRYAK